MNKKWNFHRNSKFFIEENAFRKVVCKMSAILLIFKHSPVVHIAVDYRVVCGELIDAEVHLAFTSWSKLVQVMACKPTLPYCRLNPHEQISVNFIRNINFFFEENAIQNVAYNVLPTWRSALSHYLNRYCPVVNWTLRNKLQWNFDQKWKFFIIKMHFKTSSAMSYPPGVHIAVDDRVVHGVTHGEPIDTEVHLLHVFDVFNLRLPRDEYEVHLLGQPTDAEYQHNHDHHFHHLKRYVHVVNRYTYRWYIYMYIYTYIRNIIVLVV